MKINKKILKDAYSMDDLAIQRTKLSNQRTYLSYMRTGFGIASIAGSFKKYWIMLFGLIMIVMSTLQYVIIAKNLNTKKKFKNNFDYVPLIYVFLSLGSLYLQYNK